MYGWAPGAKGFACVPSNSISDDFGIFRPLSATADLGKRARNRTSVSFCDSDGAIGFRIRASVKNLYPKTRVNSNCIIVRYSYFNCS